MANKRKKRADGSPAIAPRSKSLLFADFYHTMLSISWISFLFFYAFLFLLINFLFALAYASLGPTALEGVTAIIFADRLLPCFFFSVQTLATIGYGHVAPSSLIANLLSTAEAALGLLSIAIITGVVYARFAKPVARVLFSKNCLVNEQNGKLCLLFRMANERQNQVSEATVNIVLVQNDVTKEGDIYRRLEDIKAVRNKTSLFALSWTVMHVIDKDSPLYPCTREHLDKIQGQIVVNMSGVDETLSQNIYARHTYWPEDILWNKRFKDVIKTNRKGLLHVDTSIFHEVI